MWNINLFFFLNGFAGQSPILDGLIIFLAEYLPYVLALLFLYLVFSYATDLPAQTGRRERFTFFLIGIGAAGAARLIVEPLIHLFYRHLRPFAIFSVHQLIAESGYSFPSGHTIFFFALSAVVYRRNRRFGVIFFALSLIMGVARVMAGVHFPYDILGGAILGTFVGFVAALAGERMFSRSVTTEFSPRSEQASNKN